jgi:18S rRNA (adenine1779-N6/adenine1780-N6)-dimethyltransferase
LVQGDAFGLKESQHFDVCVTSLPYSRSLDFLEWLSQVPTPFRCAIVVLQSDFIDKIMAKPGQKNYRAISVVCQISFECKRLFPISKSEFDPPPRVSSEAVCFEPTAGFPFFNFRNLVLLKRIFSFRGRLLRSALRHFEVAPSSPLDQQSLEQRVEQVPPELYRALLENPEVLS